jgi:hypothetical protein
MLNAKWLSRVDQPTEQFKREIDDALNDIAYLATSLNPDLKKGFTIGKKLAPVEFVFIGSEVAPFHFSAH